MLWQNIEDYLPLKESKIIEPGYYLTYPDFLGKRFENKNKQSKTATSAKKNI